MKTKTLEKFVIPKEKEKEEEEFLGIEFRSNEPEDGYTFLYQGKKYVFSKKLGTYRVFYPSPLTKKLI